MHMLLKQHMHSDKGRGGERGGGGSRETHHLVHEHNIGCLIKKHNEGIEPNKQLQKQDRFGIEDRGQHMFNIFLNCHFFVHCHCRWS
jgi:hypothetical protein